MVPDKKSVFAPKSNFWPYLYLKCGESIRGDVKKVVVLGGEHNKPGGGLGGLGPDHNLINKNHHFLILLPFDP